MNSWFRLYNESVFDPKVQQLSPNIFKMWINLLCLASRNDGVIPSKSDLIFTLRLTELKVRVGINALISSGLIDMTDKGLMPHNWHDRQFKSDGSTERVKRFRERNGNVSGTLHETVSKQDRSDSDTDSEQSRTETEKEPLAISSPVVPKYTSAFENFWKMSTQRGSKKQAFAEWRKLGTFPQGALAQIHGAMAQWQQSEQWQDESKQPHICNWLKRRGWEEIVPKRAIAENQRGGLIERQSLEHTTHFCGNCEVQHDWPCGELCTTGPGPRSCPEFVGRFMH